MVAGLRYFAAALALAGVLAFAIVLGGLGLLRLLRVVLREQRGASDQTCGHGSQSDSEFSAIHETASLCGQLAFG